tara:strand:+ start:1806 stop:2027 length:222 start_codon:yes stop_codon:yes gene_type:complete
MTKDRVNNNYLYYAHERLYKVNLHNNQEPPIQLIDLPIDSSEVGIIGMSGSTNEVAVSLSLKDCNTKSLIWKK